MSRDAFLVSCRVGRWRWPWALAGFIAVVGLILVMARATALLDSWLAASYGDVEPPHELTPGRLDSFAAFVTFALALMLPPALVLALLHGIDPRRALGPGGNPRLDHFARASGAMLVVMALGLGIDLLQEPASFAWLPRTLERLPWLLLALPVILLQSFAEEYLFKGYLVRSWGAVLPLRTPIVLAVAVLFTAGHAINDDVRQDLAFNLLVFFLAELLTLAVFLRTGSLGGVTGLHWMNNVWAMGLLATLPGQSVALPLASYTDQLIAAGGSRLADPMAYLEMLLGLLLVWLLLTLPRSPFYLDAAAADDEPRRA